MGETMGFEDEFRDRIRRQQEEFRQDRPNHIAAQGGMGKSEDEVKAYILRKLGGSIVEVELAPEDLDDIISDTKRWFITRVGNKVMRPILLAPATTRYKVDQDIIAVLDVWLPTTNFFGYGTDDFSYAYSMMFGHMIYPGGTQMPYSNLMQSLQYLKMASMMFSGDRAFSFNDKTRELDIMPAPSILGMAVAEVWSGVIDTRSLQPE